MIDLSKVAFIDYRGLSVLLNARRRARHLGVDLSLACDVPSALRLLKHTRLDRDFDLHATSEDALAHNTHSFEHVGELRPHFPDTPRASGRTRTARGP